MTETSEDSLISDLLQPIDDDYFIKGEQAPGYGAY